MNDWMDESDYGNSPCFISTLACQATARTLDFLLSGISLRANRYHAEPGPTF